MSITVIFKDPENNYITIKNVSRDVSISNLRTIFKQNGGNESQGQWKFNAKIIDNSNKLSDYIPKNPPRPLSQITISTVAPVRGGFR